MADEQCLSLLAGLCPQVVRELPVTTQATTNKSKTSGRSFISKQKIIINYKIMLSIIYVCNKYYILCLNHI